MKIKNISKTICESWQKLKIYFCNKIKNINKSILLIAFIFVLFFLVPSSFALDDPSSGRNLVKIDGVGFWIPNEYFDTAEISSDSNSGGGTIIFVWPSMEGFVGKYGLMPRAGVDFGSIVSVLFQSSKSNTSLNYRKMAFQGLCDCVVPGDSAYGLDHLRASWKFPERGPSTIEEEIYYYSNGGDVEVLIVCSIPSPAIKNPQCQQSFERDGVLYQLSYSRTYLKDWYSIQENTAILFEKFRSKNN